MCSVHDAWTRFCAWYIFHNFNDWNFAQLSRFRWMILYTKMCFGNSSSQALIGWWRCDTIQEITHHPLGAPLTSWSIGAMVHLDGCTCLHRLTRSVCHYNQCAYKVCLSLSTVCLQGPTNITHNVLTMSAKHYTQCAYKVCQTLHTMCLQGLSVITHNVLTRSAKHYI